MPPDNSTQIDQTSPLSSLWGTISSLLMPGGLTAPRPQTTQPPGTQPPYQPPQPPQPPAATQPPAPSQPPQPPIDPDLFSPKTAYPPNSTAYPGFQRYTPAAGRDKGWGKDPPAASAARNDPNLGDTTFFPHDREALGIIAGAGKQLAAFGPPAVAQPMGWAAAIAHLIQPFMDFYSGNKFSTAYRSRMLGDLQAQESQMRMQQQQMDINRQRMMDYIAQAKANHSLILAEYDAVFNRMQGDHPISKEQAEEEIAELNAKHNHHVLDAMLRNHDLAGVYNQLKVEDAKFQDVVNAYVSIYESDRRRSASGTAGGDLGNLIDGGGGGGGGAFSAPAPPSAIGGAATPSPEGPDLSDDEIAKQTGMTGGKDGYGMRMAHEGLNTGKYDDLTSYQFDKEANANRSPRFGELSPAAKVRNAQNILARKIDRIADGPGTQEDKIAALDKDPDLAREAQTIKGLIGYDIPEKDIPQGETRSRFLNWAGRFSNHNYNSKNFDIVAKFSDDKRVQAMESAAALGQPARNVYAALYNRSETDTIPVNKLRELFDNAYAGGEKWAAVGGALQQLLTNIQGMQQGGTPRVTLIEEMMRRIPATASPRTIRIMVQQELSDAWARVVPHQMEWEKYGKKTLVPGFTKDALDDYSTALRINWGTGQVPDDASPAWKAISKSPGETKYPKGVDTSQPMTARVARETTLAIMAIERDPNFKNPQAPNYNELHVQYHDLLKKQSPVLNGPWMWQRE